MSDQDICNLDLSKVAALQQKRILAFVNHFVATNIQYLNSFMKKCELKLMNFERKLEKVEASMVLLEARLSSIPEVSNITTHKQTTEKPIAAPTEQNNAIKIAAHKEQGNATIAPQKENVDDVTTENLAVSNTEVVDNSVQVPPEYERFVKMVHVGVPLEAVKLKASLEGLDPDILVKVLGKY